MVETCSGKAEEQSKSLVGHGGERTNRQTTLMLVELAMMALVNLLADYTLERQYEELMRDL